MYSREFIRAANNDYFHYPFVCRMFTRVWTIKKTEMLSLQNVTKHSEMSNRVSIAQGATFKSPAFLI